MTTQYLFYILFGYLSGSVLYGYLLPKYIKKIDVTKESPDQNPGVANAFLCAGAPIGFCALMLELLKGYLPVHAAMHVLNPRHLILVWCWLHRFSGMRFRFGIRRWEESQLQYHLEYCSG